MTIPDILAATCAAIAMICVSSAGQAKSAYTYTTIPEPPNNDSEGNAGWGVGPRGTVVGAIFTANFDDAGATGFTFANNVFTALNYPGASFTVPHAMSKNGTIAGEAGINGISGFLVTKSGSFTSYKVSGCDFYALHRAQ